VDQYLLEGPRTTDWLAPGVVKQHRTIGTHVSHLLRAGFELTELIEWGPSADQIAKYPSGRSNATAHRSCSSAPSDTEGSAAHHLGMCAC